MDISDLHVDQSVFADLLESQQDFVQVFDVFYTTIMLSFRIVDTAALGKQSVISTDEVRRRWKLCERWFRMMRGDLGYSLNKTLDSIPTALVCELTEQEFIPDSSMRGYAGTADALRRARIVKP